MKVIKRDGTTVDFDRSKIVIAIQKANAAVEALARRFGAAYLDLNAPLRDENGCLKAEYTLEGIHMYADGYRALLPALLPALREA